ncbi:hypothetical protein [Phenylobacterium terrae]
MFGIRHVVLAGLLCGLNSGCGDRQPTVEETVFESTGTVYALSSADRDQLVLRARKGDAEAAYRLWQYYDFAGGEDGIPDASDKSNARHWLEAAASRGHEFALFDLAVITAEVDCRQSRDVLQRLSRRGSTQALRSSASSWLQEPVLRC